MGTGLATLARSKGPIVDWALWLFVGSASAERTAGGWVPVVVCFFLSFYIYYIFLSLSIFLLKMKNPPCAFSIKYDFIGFLSS